MDVNAELLSIWGLTTSQEGWLVLEASFARRTPATMPWRTVLEGYCGSDAFWEDAYPDCLLLALYPRPRTRWKSLGLRMFRSVV